MLKAIIVDDEARARRILENYIKDYCPQVQILAIVEDVPQAIIAINAFNPDIVFLDIEMPNFNGFQLLDSVNNITFEIIFTTAYSAYALKAFQVSAIDYLLKPIQANQLIAAVKKVEKIQGSSMLQERIKTLQQNLVDYKVKKIVVPMSEGSLFVELKDIIYLKAEGSYVSIFFKDGTKILVSKNIKDYEDQLTNNEGFFRTHRSFLVNANFVHKISSDGTEAVLTNGILISISRDRKQEFISFMRGKYQPLLPEIN
jgi:two-component system LytT family response regulator